MRHNTSKTNSNLVTEALVAAEADGLNVHGLSRLPSYCAQAASGKVDGHAAPTVSLVANATIRVDVKNGFAFPNLVMAVKKLSELMKTTGIDADVVTRSHHCGAAGFHVESLARKGLVGLLFANTPRRLPSGAGRKGCLAPIPSPLPPPEKKRIPL